MTAFLNGIRYGISYFTIFPTYLKSFEATNQFYKGVLFSLPLAGLFMGLCIIILNYIVPFPKLYGAIFFSILYLFLNGFIHLEAVADTIDGYFSSLSNKDVYMVMKEPQVGAIGAIGTFCFAIFLILGISYLLYFDHYLILILCLILSRSVVFFALDDTFHKESHFIHSLQKSIKVNIVFKLLFLPLNLLTKFILRKLKNSIGFLNGDTLGFTIVLIEIILLNIAIIIDSINL
jgi:adenosylcobinamide-GDP ribazoletransferase